MRFCLWTHPKIVRIAKATKQPRAAIVGAAYRLWSLANEHTADGKLEYDTDYIDTEVGVPGFSLALSGEGWLNIADSFVTIPEWEAYNDSSAKKRLYDAKRQRESRKTKPKVSQKSRFENDKSVTSLRQKCDHSIVYDSVEENNKGLTTLASPAIAVLPIEEKSSHKTKPRSEKQIERDALFDAVAIAFYPSGASKDDAALIGRTVTALKAKNAAPAQIAERLARWPRLYPDAGPLTPPGLAKHWDALGCRLGPPTPKPRRNEGIENEAQDFVYQRALAKWKQENGD